jgi:hypothetical protein
LIGGRSSMSATGFEDAAMVSGFGRGVGRAGVDGRRRRQYLGLGRF